MFFMTYQQIKSKIVKRTMREIFWWQSLSKEIKDNLLQEYVSTLKSLGYNTQINQIKHHHILSIYHNQKSK